MKKSTLDKIEEEVNKKTKLSKENKKEIRKKILLNIAIALMIIVYFVEIILLSINSFQSMKELYLKISSIVSIIIAIIIFEVAYKKDSGKIAIFGIEVLIMAITNLFLPYLLYRLNIEYIKIIIISIGVFSLYYVIKILTIYIYNKRKILKHNSDIKNIIKKESSYPEKVEIVVPKEKKAKRGRPKKNIKEETKVINNKTNDNAVTKKRGRPKKTEEEKTNKKENNNVSKKANNTSTKRRGRPKKENTNNNVNTTKKKKVEDK